jgi:hypothetical protein
LQGSRDTLNVKKCDFDSAHALDQEFWTASRYRRAIAAAGTGCLAALKVEEFLEDHGR